MRDRNRQERRAAFSTVALLASVIALAGCAGGTPSADKQACAANVRIMENVTNNLTDTRRAVLDADLMGDLIPNIQRKPIRVAAAVVHATVPLGFKRNAAGGFADPDGFPIVLDAIRDLDTECQRVGL